MATLRFVDLVDESSFSSSEVTRVYKKRWLMLLVFVLCAISNSSHWLQYTNTFQSVVKYYGISLLVLDLTATVYSITFVLFVFPAIWCIHNAGLKWMLVIGDSMMIVGSLMKVVSVEPQYFYVGFGGQVLLGIAQVFIVNVPSFLAGTWFPPKEVSTACSVGVLGTQIGIVISYLMPPLIISNSHDMKQLKVDFLWVYIILSVLPVVLLPVLLFFFDNRPLHPPSLAQSSKRKATEKPKFMLTLRQLLGNYNFIMVNISYSFSVSVFYCMSTLIDQLVSIHYSESRQLVGILGIIMISFGIIGCLVCGWILDRMRKFKFLALVNYCLAACSLVVFWVGLHSDSRALMFFACVGMGIFLASYVIVAIEFSSELTYPIHETIPTSVLLANGEMLSVVLIYGSAILLQAYGDWAVLYMFVGFMFFGIVATALINKPKLRRRDASRAEHSPKSREGHNMKILRKNDSTKGTKVDEPAVQSSPTKSPEKSRSRVIKEPSKKLSVG